MMTRLYLVSEVNNKYDQHAVMVHDGERKIASVCAEDAPKVRALLEAWRTESSSDDVLVCSIEYVSEAFNAEKLFRNRGTLKIRGRHRVNERLARKYVKERGNRIDPKTFELVN
jgi:nuclear transport factor 2 (NTF2) superfamily protein